MAGMYEETLQHRVRQWCLQLGFDLDGATRWQRTVAERQLRTWRERDDLVHLLTTVTARRVPPDPFLASTAALSIPWPHTSRFNGGEAVCFLGDELVAPPRIICMRRRTERTLFMHEPLRHIAVHEPTQLLLGIGINSGTLFAWSAEGCTKGNLWTWHHARGVCQTATSHHPQLLGAVCADGTCFLLRLDNKHTAPSLLRFFSGMLDIHILVSGAILYRNARTWAVSTCNIEGPGQHEHVVWPPHKNIFANAMHHCAAAPDECIILARGGTILRVHLATGEVLAEAQQELTHAQPSAKLVACAEYLALREGEYVVVRRRSSPTLAIVRTLPIALLGTLQFHRDGAWLATCQYARPVASATTDVHVWEEFTT